MLLTVPAAVPPPGSCHTATAIRMRIAKLRRWVLRSGPTTRNDTRPDSGADRRRRGLDRRRGHALGAGRDLDRGCRLADRVERLGREAVPDPEVRVDVAPARRHLL